MYNLDEELKDPKYYTPDQTRREIENMLSTSVEGTITFEKLLNVGRLPNQEVVDEYREKGLIVDKPFLVTKTEKELARSNAQKAKLNQDIQDILQSDQIQNIINSSVSKEEAQSKINAFIK